MFSYDEVEALVAGARMVEAWGSPELAKFSRSALAKIAGALPPARRDELEKPRLFALNFRADPAVAQTLETIRQAITRRVVLDIDYSDAKSAASQRLVRPIGLYFWGSVWTLGAWCEARTDFRNFRLDRMQRVALSDRRFVEEPGKRTERFPEEDAGGAFRRLASSADGSLFQTPYRIFTPIRFRSGDQYTNSGLSRSNARARSPPPCSSGCRRSGRGCRRARRWCRRGPRRPPYCPIARHRCLPR